MNHWQHTISHIQIITLLRWLTLSIVNPPLETSLSKTNVVNCKREYYSQKQKHEIKINAEME